MEKIYGILLTEISNHVPIFHIIEADFHEIVSECTSAYRKYNDSEKVNFIAEIQGTDWSFVLDETNDPGNALDFFVD